MDKEILFAFIRTLIALPLVLLLAYLVIRYGLARRGPVQANGTGRRMRVIEQLPLGSKGVLNLVEVGGKYYLLAQSENGFTLVKEFDTLPDEIDDKGLNSSLPEFCQVLQGKLKQYASRKHKDKTEGDSGCEN
ncbi:MAG: flagellar biosynthetic protein FliO [Desulfotomaculum sp.]|nr:flagellar biosynthetic protein FliO [Desulfotomaculum sp.]